MSNSSIVPTYNGYIHNTRDALAVIQQVLDKQLEPVSRRPHERERGILIVSGSVFVFIEQLSGIKRWTDGISWSPSRIQGRFLVYGELDKKNLIDKDKKKKRSVNLVPTTSTTTMSMNQIILVGMVTTFIMTTEITLIRILDQVQCCLRLVQVVSLTL